MDTILGPGIIPFTLVVQCCSGGIKSHYNMHFWVVISHIQWFMVSTINWTQWIKHIRHNSFLWIFRGMDTLAGKVPFSNLLEVIYSKKEKSLHPGRVNSFFLEFSFQKLGGFMYRKANRKSKHVFSSVNMVEISIMFICSP